MNATDIAIAKLEGLSPDELKAKLKRALEVRQNNSMSDDRYHSNGGWAAQTAYIKAIEKKIAATAEA